MNIIYSYCIINILEITPFTLLVYYCYGLTHLRGHNGSGNQWMLQGTKRMHLQLAVTAIKCTINLASY